MGESYKPVHVKPLLHMPKIPREIHKWIFHMEQELKL